MPYNAERVPSLIACLQAEPGRDFTGGGAGSAAGRRCRVGAGSKAGFLSNGARSDGRHPRSAVLTRILGSAYCAVLRLARRIQTLRTERGLSRQALAGLAGISREYVRLLEAGRYDATVTVIRRLAKALKVKPSALID